MIHFLMTIKIIRISVTATTQITKMAHQGKLLSSPVSMIITISLPSSLFPPELVPLVLLDGAGADAHIAE